MKNIQIVLKFLANLNLSIEESLVYISLLEQGDLTKLQISKLKKIPRTSVYRIINLLSSKGLVEEIKINKKIFVKAVGIERLEILVKEAENRVGELKTILPEISNLITNFKSIEQNGTSFKIYSDKIGIERLMWNTLRAKEQVTGFIYNSLNTFFDVEFIEKYKNEIESKQISFKLLTNDEMLIRNTNENFIKIKTIERQKLEINFELFLYNNIICVFHKYEKELIGYEVIDKKLSKLLNQLFIIAYN